MEIRFKPTNRIALAAISVALLLLAISGFAGPVKAASTDLVGPPEPAASGSSASSRVISGAPASAPESAGAAPASGGSESSAAAGNAPSSGGSAPTSGGSAPTDSSTDSAGAGSAAANPTEEQATSGSASVAADPDASAMNSGGNSASASGAPLRVTPLSVPNFMIDKFEIPPFLLPIYQACGTEYGIPWTVLAAINRIETGFGTNLGTSYAGALGWMQFLDSSWKMFGVDANGDKVKDPYNPVDAICAAANYLKIAGYEESPRKAIFAYNHADWYVDDILQHAAAYGKIPTEVITALTGLTEGARFPVADRDATYAGQLSTKKAKKKGLAAGDVKSSAGRDSIEISGGSGSPVIAVNDGVISAIDQTGGTVTLTDAYGNRYTYSGLGSVAKVHPVPRERKAGSTKGTDAPEPGDQATQAADQMGAAKAADNPQGGDAPSVDEAGDISEVKVDPDEAARAAEQASAPESPADDSSPVATAEARRSAQENLTSTETTEEAGRNTEDIRRRVYANPLRPKNQHLSSTDGQSLTSGSGRTDSVTGKAVQGKPGDYVIYDGSRTGVYKFKRGAAELQQLKKGSRVIAGTVLGRLAETGSRASVVFSIRPGGQKAPKIDPKPFLDGWRLLAETNIYNSKGGNRFANRLGVGGVLLLSKSALQRRVLADPGLDIYECGRQDIASGFTDRRVLAMLAFLRERGFTMTITSLTCGHGVNTSSGNLSEHTTGTAVDIAVFNGEVVTPSTQGPGSLTDQAARAVMSLQGAMAPHQVISLLDYDNGIGFAMSDHGDHLHVGFSPEAGKGGVKAPFAALGPEQWKRLTDRLGEIDNPEIPTEPSGNAIPAEPSETAETTEPSGNANPAGEPDDG